MNADTLKAFFTYLTAFIVVAGGFYLLYQVRAEAASSNLQVIIGGFIGSALTFLFVQENSTRASRSAERQMSIGANTATPTTVNASGDTTVTGGDPTNVTVAKK